jgi:hypothetical protein
MAVRLLDSRAVLLMLIRYQTLGVRKLARWYYCWCCRGDNRVAEIVVTADGLRTCLKYTSSFKNVVFNLFEKSVAVHSSKLEMA